MVADHRRILATAIARLRGKIKYRPIVFELMPPSFTLLQLQRTVEALAGVRLHKPNFRRLVEQQGCDRGDRRGEHRDGRSPRASPALPARGPARAAGTGGGAAAFAAARLSLRSGSPLTDSITQF